MKGKTLKELPGRLPKIDLAKLGHLLPPRRRRPGYVALPILVLLTFVVVGTFAPLIAPHSATEISLSHRYQPPGWYDSGDWSYPLGTDAMGRDILSRLIYGSRVTLLFAVLSIALGGTVGAILGIVAGYYGRWVDAVIMRLVDLALSIPIILLAISLAVILEPSLQNLVLVVGLIIWAYYARQARGETLSIKEKDYVSLARTSGLGPHRIVIRHIVPNLVHSLIVLATLQVGWVILVEASLSFLGVGIPPPDPAWGSMVAGGRNVLDSAWWVSLFPGLAIGVVVLSLNVFGDWLRDTLDPRLRQV